MKIIKTVSIALLMMSFKFGLCHGKIPDDSTVVQIYYQGLIEENLIKLQVYQDYVLENYGLLGIRHQNQKIENGLEYKFSLNKPKLINIGFHIIYMEPYDTIKINYSFGGYAKTRTPIESISMKGDRGAVISKNGDNIYSTSKFREGLAGADTFVKLKRVFNQHHIDSLVNLNVNEIYNYNPLFKKDIIRDDFFKQLVQQNCIIIYLDNYQYRKSDFTPDEQNLTCQFIKELFIRYSKSITIRNFQFYGSAQKYTL